MNAQRTTRILDELLLRIDHVGIAVADWDRALAFWTTVAGFRVVHTEENHEQLVREAMLEAPGGGSQLQLLAPIDDNSTIARFLQRSGPGLQQLAVQVSDVTEAAARLVRHGLRVLYPEPRRGTAGTRINFVHPHDAGGVLLELVEYPPASVDG